MLDADERQEWSHASGKLVEMVAIVWDKLEEQGIPRHLAEQMLLVWWTQSLTPKVEFPDLKGIFGQDDDD
jgi:hypothetical protein